MLLSPMLGLGACYLAHERPVPIDAGVEDASVCGRLEAADAGLYGRVVQLAGPAPVYQTDGISTDHTGTCSGQLGWSGDGSRLVTALADPDVVPRSTWGWPSARLSVNASAGRCWSRVVSVPLGHPHHGSYGDAVWDTYGSRPLAASDDGSVVVLALSSAIAAAEIYVLTESSSGWIVQQVDNSGDQYLWSAQVAYSEGDLFVEGYWLPLIHRSSSRDVLRRYDPSTLALEWQNEAVPAQIAAFVSLAIGRHSHSGAIAFGGNRGGPGASVPPTVRTFVWGDVGYEATGDLDVGFSVDGEGTPAVAISDDASVLVVGARLWDSSLLDAPIRVVDRANGNALLEVSPDTGGAGVGWCLDAQTVSVDAGGTRVAWVSGDATEGTVANVAERVGDQFVLRWRGRPAIQDSGPCRGSVDVESLALSPDGRLAVVGRTPCAPGEMGMALAAARVWVLE